MFYSVNFHCNALGLRQDKVYELSFMFRVRNESGESNESDTHTHTLQSTHSSENLSFYNCFASFWQRPRGLDDNNNNPSSSSMYRQAVVLVSHWPIPQLAFQLLFKLDEAFFLHVLNIRPPIDASDSESIENSSIEFRKQQQTAAENLVSVAELQFSMWPEPAAGSLVLPFMGEMIQYALPAALPSVYTSSLGVMFEGINIISLLGPLGLLLYFLITLSSVSPSLPSFANFDFRFF